MLQMCACYTCITILEARAQNCLTWYTLLLNRIIPLLFWVIKIFLISSFVFNFHMQNLILQEQLQLPVNQKARNMLADIETKVVFSYL